MHSSKNAPPPKGMGRLGSALQTTSEILEFEAQDEDEATAPATAVTGKEET